MLNKLAGKRSNGLTDGPLWACAAFWLSSYLVPLYFLPITIFAALWLAVIVWGLVLCSPMPRITRVSHTVGARLLVCSPALGLVCLAGVAYKIPVDALVILTAASAFLFGLHCEDRRWFIYLVSSISAAAATSVLIALIQLLFPTTDFMLIAPLAQASRATANLRQPNLLAQLLLLGSAGLMFLSQTAARPQRWVGYAIAFALGCGVAFTQSRTGFLGLLLLLMWGVFDKGLLKNTRWIPAAAALGCIAALAGMAGVAHLTGATIYVEAHQAAGADMSSSRFGIWKNALSLLAMYPLTGVGWGNFAQAWALTPFSGRSHAAFDNAHNLPLHLLVELGIPLALFIMILFLVPLWWARYAVSYRLLASYAVKARCLVMMLALLGMHSMLEYPLWYSFFLLPAAFFLGQLIQLGALAQGARAGPDRPGESSGSVDGRRPLVAVLLQCLGVGIVLVSIYAVWDYSRVLQVFFPFAEGIFAPLEDRIAEGRKSKLFGYWVDYAVVTNAETYTGLDAQMHRALHNRMNPHMLLVYAKYLNERGEKDKAAYVAERLKEFDNPIAADFFAECKDATKKSTAFQCSPAKGTYTFKDFD